MNKVYCVTDLHGNYELWKHIQNYLDDTDTLYCLGDNNDRGQDGIKIIQEMLVDQRVKYLLGNHECFLIGYIYRILKFIEGLDIELDKKFQDYMNDEKVWRQYNGGVPTINTINQMYNDNQVDKLLDLYNQLISLPVFAGYCNKNNQIIYLSHSGCSSKTLQEKHLEDKFFTFIENRVHLNEQHWSGKDNAFMVHGHTPIQSITAVQDKVFPLFYCNNHKIDLDICTYVTKYAILFDLDELYPYYVEEEKGVLDEESV